MNEQLKIELIAEMKKAGFPWVEKVETLDFQIYRSTYNGILAAVRIGLEAWKKETGLGPKVVAIVEKFYWEYGPKPLNKYEEL